MHAKACVGENGNKTKKKGENENARLGADGRLCV